MYKILGFKIKQKREERNLTQEAMAEMLQISQKAYSNLENGRNVNLNLERIARITEILDLNLSDLLKISESDTYNNINNPHQTTGFVINKGVQQDELEVIIKSLSSVFEEALKRAIAKI